MPGQFSDRLIPFAERIRGTVETKRIGRARLAITEQYSESGRGSYAKYLRREEGVRPYRLLDFHWSFSSGVREPYLGTNGTAYGSRGVTFRWLYALLASRYGDFIGKFFALDVYVECGEELKAFVLSCRRGYYDDALIRLQYELKRALKSYLKYGGAGSVSLATLKRRLISGISSASMFYATGQLVDDIYITVSMPREAFRGYTKTGV